MAENLNGAGIAAVQVVPNQTLSGAGIATAAAVLGSVNAGTLTVNAVARAPFSASSGDLASGRYRR